MTEGVPSCDCCWNFQEPVRLGNVRGKYDYLREGIRHPRRESAESLEMVQGGGAPWT